MKTYRIMICCLAIAVQVLLPGSLLSQEPPTATLVIYQKSSWAGGPFNLYINDQAVAEPIKERGWFKVEVPVGRLKLETRAFNRFSSFENKTFYLEVDTGKTYHLEALIDYDLMISRMFLYLRTEQECLEAISRYKPDPDAKRRIE